MGCVNAEEFYILSLIKHKAYTSFTKHTGSSHCSVRMGQSS